MKMTTRLLLLPLCFFAIPLAVHAQRATDAVVEEAGKYSKAVLTNDYAKVISYTQERVIETMGGKDAAIGLLKKSSEDMKAKGFGIEDVKIGDANEPKKIGPWTVTIVAEALKLKMPGNKAIQESFLLAISGDDSKTWKFIDLGPLSDEQLFHIFPELKGKFQMPPKKPAVPEKAP
jgi:hypothetical protein